MTMVSRLKKTAAVLAAAAGVTSAYFYAWGDAGNRKTPVGVAETPRVTVRLATDVAAGRFSALPVLNYEADGGSYFALQLKPNLPASPARPRDIVIVIDTSASQAGLPLQLARRLAEAVVNDAAPNDRVSIRTANIPKASKALTAGLQDPKSAVAAFRKLDDEYAAGATDLKAAIDGALKDFEGKTGRQQVVLFLGDCESAYNPLNEKDRLGLAEKMLQASVGFFAVPLGAPNAKNLHTLVSGTGGAVVRFLHDDARQENSDLSPVVKNINDLLAVPVMVPTQATFAQMPAEVFPSKLPPLRADTPTLVIGRYEGKRPTTIDLALEGKIAGHATKVSVSEKMAPTISEHYFLPNLVKQWRESGTPEAPAMLRSDRTLAMAYEQTRLAVDEMLTQANWAMGSNQIEVARHLFRAAGELKKEDPEARAGLQLVEKVKSGQITPKQFQDALANTRAAGEKRATEMLARQDVKPKDVPPVTGDPIPAPAPGVSAKGQQAGDELLRQEQSRRAVMEQQVKLLVDETLSTGRRLLAEGDPASAEALLKQQRDAIRGNPDISDANRQRLLASIETLVREVNTRGAEIVRRRAEESEQIARGQARLAANDAFVAEQNKIRERIAAFATLMRQARFEEQYREAQAMAQESLANAQPILGVTVANYMMGQAATNLREFRELVRLREDRYLLTMMQVEKSAIPYPDEPPVHFPPSKVWRELVATREKFAGKDLAASVPERARNRMKFLNSALESPLDKLDQPLELPLSEVLNILEDLASPPDARQKPERKVKILVDERELGRAKGEPMFDAGRVNIKLPRLTGASLATVLRIICSQIDASYWVRRDYIEITSAEAAIKEKVTVAFGVADLVVPIPSAISQQALQQGLQVLGATFSLGGGGSPVAGAFGAQVQGQFIGGGFGGGFGAGGGQQQGGFQALQNTFQGQQNVNLGAQGGLLGFGGGQLGQFGNLGGQFGFQGGTQHQILIELIQSVIARGEWVTAQSALVTGNTNTNDPNAQGSDSAIIPADQLNSMGFYPPALALVVRATSRFHPSSSSRLIRGGGGAAAALPGNGPAMAANGGAGNENVIGQLAGNLAAKNDEKVGIPVRKGFKQAQEEGKLDLDSKKIWTNVLAKTDIKNPGPVVDTVGTLGVMDRFDHAAELIKASLRKGVTPEPWAHEALAQALENTQGDPIEIERARLSIIDLQPRDAQSYLKAAKAISKDDAEHAIKLCGVAAKLEPELADPYISAITYAAKASGKGDVASLTWAAGNLLSRDWATDNVEYHAMARRQLEETAAKLAGLGRNDDAANVRGMLEADKRRDLSIQLIWTNGGERETAGLDLVVSEPTGSVASAVAKQTAGGGVLMSDYYQGKDGGHVQTYTASEAFTGDYTVKIDKVWGRPLGNKATLKVIRNQGTPDEKVEIHTLDLAKETELKVTLREGRRSKIAAIPAPNVATDGNRKPERQEQVMNKLRAMTEPVFAKQMEGGVATSFRSPTLAKTDKPLTRDFSWTGRVDALISDGVEMQAKVVLGSNGEQKMVLSPIFNTNGKTKPGVKIDLVPGGEG